jgi:hypothetical protein
MNRSTEAFMDDPSQGAGWQRKDMQRDDADGKDQGRVTPPEVGAEHAAQREEDAASQLPGADAAKAAPEISELEKIQKDLLWGMYLELRTHARHAETVRANAINYVLVVTAALITVMTIDRDINGDDLALCLSIVFIGVFATVFSMSYIERYSRNRQRAEGVRKDLDERFLSGHLEELYREAAERTRKRSKVLYLTRRVTITTHLFWLGLPVIVLGIGIILTVVALTAE